MERSNFEPQDDHYGPITDLSNEIHLITEVCLIMGINPNKANKFIEVGREIKKQNKFTINGISYN